ncbi:MAG TPA: PD-(D/E)XK nuclease family protein [Acidimicrobiia bacterium]|nr:PD-(D/E)XK nuclease family protein [Acidimicrobiia bacterium]
MDDAPLPRVTPSLLRDAPELCPRRVALDFADEGGARDPVSRARLRGPFLDAARAAHGEGGRMRREAFVVPTDLEPEEQRVFAQAVGWYEQLFGAHEVETYLHDCESPTERRGIRVGGWVDLTVVRTDGTKELRQLDLWAGRVPSEDPLELPSVWLAVLRLRPWIGDGDLVVTWADLVRGLTRTRVVRLGAEIDGLRDRFDSSLRALRDRADADAARPGTGCAQCKHIGKCPAHPGAVRLSARARDLRPGILRVTPSSLDAWRRCPRAWRNQYLLSVPASDDSGSPDHGLLVHDVLRFLHDHGTCHDPVHVDEVLEAHGGSSRLREELHRHIARCPSPADALGHEIDLARFAPASPASYSFLATARLDAVWIHDGILDARDYKTGAVWGSRVADDPRAWLQVFVLEPVARARGLRLRLRYEHLSAEVDDDPEPWDPEDEELVELEARVRAQIAEIRDARGFPGVAEPRVCGWCRYHSICPESAAPGEPQWPSVGLEAPRSETPDSGTAGSEAASA